ncbi:hypothetical protein [Bradyrhizobium sp. 62]|uniref:hypothetical protein n=1 Tax=Bradyrhizobium sp. 62 TaxID=1043588 RepID=UPI001FFB9CBE|nr:hypothetical protein [Bradyrhizobium sp. 62]MCK1367632.1 hypothetical protein [Bradyrhizobium sp. 62]
MTAVLIRFPEPPKGNGARGALIETMKTVEAHVIADWDAPAAADWILADLWARGFKVVSVE